MTLHMNDTRALFFIGRLYFHPSEIVKDPSIPVKRKRSLLADWASDRNAVESKPALRRNPVTGAQCTLAEIISALRSLDDDPLPPASMRPPPNAQSPQVIHRPSKRAYGLTFQNKGGSESVVVLISLAAL